MRAYIITTCQNVQPLMFGICWKIVQMKRKPVNWTSAAEKSRTTKSAS